MMKHDVFVSFSFSDREAAENLVNILSSRYGISCWICTYDLNGGNLFKELIPEAIDAAKVVVFVQSAYSIASREVPKEIGIAFDAEKTIIPFRLDQTPLAGALRYDLYGLEFIDGTIPSFEARVAELADSILRVLGKRTGQEHDSNSRTFELLSTPIGFSEIFFGRDEDIKAVHEAFKERNIVFLHGMGGIGKSELAKRYAKTYRNEYKTVVFAQYDGSLSAQLANDSIFNVKDLLRRSKADGTLETDEEYSTEKLSVIKKISDEHTLIILDNFDTTDDPMLETLAAGPYHLLVTSRSEPDRSKYYVQQVKELDDETLKAMFIAFANPGTTMIDPDDPAFPELFDMTGRHTLTLELVANYMEEKCIDDISEMVELLRSQHIGVLDQSDNKHRAAALEGLFRMTEMSSKEKDFLRWLGLMPLEGIGQKLFRDWCGNDIFMSRTRLAALGLVRINPTEKKISLHPIVRQIVLSQLPVTLDDSKEFFDKVCSSIYLSWNWPVGQKMAAAEFTDNVMEKLGALNEDNYTLYYTFGILRNLCLSYDRVMPFWQELYDYSVALDGPSSIRAGLAAYRAGWYSKNYDIDAAIMWLEDRAYPILKANRDEVPKEIPHALSNLAHLYKKKYDISGSSEYLKRAQEYLDEALEEAEHAYDSVKRRGDEAAAENVYIKMAGVFMEMADVSIRKREFEEAEKHIAKALEMLPKSSVSDIYELTYLRGEVQYGKGFTEDALASYTSALDGLSALFSENDPQILMLHIALGDCLEKLSDKEKARYHWNAAYKIAKVLLAEDHPTLKRIEGKLRSFS